MRDTLNDAFLSVKWKNYAISIPIPIVDKHQTKYEKFYSYEVYCENDARANRRDVDDQPS